MNEVDLAQEAEKATLASEESRHTHSVFYVCLFTLNIVILSF